MTKLKIIQELKDQYFIIKGSVAEVIEGFQPLNYRSGKTVNSITSHDQLLVYLMKLTYHILTWQSDRTKHFSDVPACIS